MCSGALIPDIMHDLLEGSIQHTIMLMIGYLTKDKKFFSLKYLNQKIEGMELGYMEDNRPSPISKKDKTLKQNGMLKLKLIIILIYSIPIASQTWTLARLLPIMIGSKVPVGNEYWQFFLLSLTVTDLLLCPDIQPEEVAHLKVLLKEHHERFTELFPNASVIPKMHFLLHVPQLILK